MTYFRTTKQGNCKNCFIWLSPNNNCSSLFDTKTSLSHWIVSFDGSIRLCKVSRGHLDTGINFPQGISGDGYQPDPSCFIGLLRYLYSRSNKNLQSNLCGWLHIFHYFQWIQKVVKNNPSIPSLGGFIGDNVMVTWILLLLVLPYPWQGCGPYLSICYHPNPPSIFQYQHLQSCPDTVPPRHFYWRNSWDWPPSYQLLPPFQCIPAPDWVPQLSCCLHTACISIVILIMIYHLNKPFQLNLKSAKYVLQYL